MTDQLAHLARVALREDAPDGDVTSRATIPGGTVVRAEIVVKQAGVLAGAAAAAAVFAAVAEEDRVEISVDWKAADGDAVAVGDRAAVLRGDARGVLRAERPALNLLGHLSGIATLTRAFVEAAAPARVLCTRKTLPGLRAVERDAVASGGGTLHRASLSDAVLIKDTHVRIAGGVREAIRRARTAGLAIEVEVETLEQLVEALDEGAERILLDNPTPERVRAALATIDDPARLEISGGLTLDSVAAFVEAGGRVVSVGRLTHSAPSLDISLEVVAVDA